MTRIFRKYVLYCNGIDPFIMLMGNFNWEPISRNDMLVSDFDTVFPLCCMVQGLTKAEVLIVNVT